MTRHHAPILKLHHLHFPPPLAGDRYPPASQRNHLRRPVHHAASPKLDLAATAHHHQLTLLDRPRSIDRLRLPPPPGSPA